MSVARIARRARLRCRQDKRYKYKRRDATALARKQMRMIEKQKLMQSRKGKK